MFFWICPGCTHENYYKGSKITNVVVQCKSCKAKVKASSHKKPEIKVSIPERNYQTQPKTTNKLPIYITPQTFMAKILKLLQNDLNTTLLEDKKKRLIRVLTAGDAKGNNYAWIRDSLMVFIDYCIQKGLLKLEEEKG